MNGDPPPRCTRRSVRIRHDEVVEARPWFPADLDIPNLRPALLM